MTQREGGWRRAFDLSGLRYVACSSAKAPRGASESALMTSEGKGCAAVDAAARRALVRMASICFAEIQTSGRGELS